MASFVGDKGKKKVVSKGGVGSKPAPKPSPKPTSKPPSTQPARRTQPPPAPKTKPVLTPAERRRDYPGAQGYPPKAQPQEPSVDWEALRSWAPPPAREEIENKLATWKPRIGPVQRDEQVTNTFLPVFQTRPADRPAPRPSTLTRPEVNRDVPPIGVSAPIGGRTETLRSPSPVSSSDRLRGPYFSAEQIDDKLSEDRRRLRAEASVGRVAAMGLAVPKPPPSAGPFTTAVAQANAPNLGVLSLDDIGEFRFPGGQAAAVEQRAETKFERIGRSQEENARLAQERLEAAFPQVTSPLTGDSMTIGVNPLQLGASLWSRLRATPATEKFGEAVATTGAVVGTMADAFFSMAGSAPFIDPMFPGLAQSAGFMPMGSPANVIGEVLESAEDTAAENAHYQWMPKWLQKGMAWMGLLNPSNFWENLGIGLRAMPEIEANALAMAAQTGDEVIARNALYSGTMAEAEDLIAKHETTLAELPRQIMVAQQQAAFAAGNGDFPSAEQWRLEAAKLGAQYATMKEMKTVDVVQPVIDPLKDTFFNVVLDLTNVLDIPGGIIAEGFRVGAAMEIAGAVDEAGAALNVAEATARANLVNQNALDAARAAGLVQIDQAQEAAVDVMRAANPAAFADEAGSATGDTARVPLVDDRLPLPEASPAAVIDEVAAASPSPTAAATTAPSPAPRGPSNPAALMPPGKAVDIRKMPGVPLAKDEAASRGWRKLFGLTTESLAVQRRDTVMQALASVVSPIKGITINDARHLITTLIDEPMALVRGVPATAFETEAIRAMAGPDGLIKFGPGLVAPSNMKEYWPYLTAARDQILGLPTLTGRGPLNKMAFVGELDDVIYDTARQLLGRPRSFSEVPPFTRRWDVRKVPGTGDGTGTPSMSEVIFYDQKHGGVELGRTAPMPTGDAKRYKGALAAAVNAQGASSRLAETLALPMKFQRAIMTDMFLGFRPANWVKNAGAAYGTMLADDLLTFVPMTDALAALEAKLGPTFGSNRIVDASKGVAGGAMPGDLSHHWSDRFRDGPLGGVARAYGKLAKRALNIPYGATGLKIGNIELPIGEQNFYTRIFQKAFERAFNKEWPIVVARAFTTPLLKAGVPPEIAKQLTDLMIQVGRTGSKDDVIRAMRKAISDNFVAPTLAKLGVNPDLLPSGLQARITNILTNPSRLSLEEVIQQIDEAFAPHLERASGLADAASVSPAPQEFTTASRVDDLDDAEQQMREALVNAGMPPGVAQDVAAEHAAGVKVAEQKAVAALLSEVVSLPSSLHSADITLAYWMRYSEMTQRWRQATDAINQAAFAEIGRLKKAGGAGAETTNVWMKTANDLANLHKKFLDDLKKLTDDIRLEQAADAPPVRGAVNDEQMTAFRAQMKTWETFDAEANAAIRGKEIPLGAGGDAEAKEIIDAGRAYTEYHMMEAFSKWQATPTMDGLDHLAQAMKLSHEAGHKTAIEAQRLWREAREGRLPWEEARQQVNALWRDLFEQEGQIWQAAGNVAGSAVPFSATADAPVFIPISPRTRNRLMDVGSEFYRKNWGDARDRLVSHMTGGREASANALSEDQAKRLIDGIEQLIRERDAVRPVQSVTRDMLLARMKQVPNWTEEQAEAVIKLLDQRAKVWSRITGETEEAWYQAYIADIKASRGVTGKDVRFQAGDVTTPEFKRWFGKSVLVDENGQPIRFFHGSKSPGFDQFAPEQGRRIQAHGHLGIFFSDDPEIASRYASLGRGHGGVYPVYLRMENPARLSAKDADDIFNDMPLDIADNTPEAWRWLRERLQEQGHDGVIWRWSTYDETEYIVFDQAQIKSVFNAGEWSDEGNLLHQGAKGAMQPLEDGRAVIHAFRNADFSTIIHETWHVFERDMADIAKRFPDTDMAKDYAELRKWAKAQYDRLQPKRKWANENIGISEVIAEAGELYAREGRAPTEALKNVFEKFKEWMLAIYKSLRADWPKMDNDVRGIFDRMLTVNDDIARATDEVAPLAPAPPAPVAPVATAPTAPAAPLSPPLAPSLQGRATTGWTDPARKYEMQYEVVELDDLVASNSVDGVVNPSYPAQFQPRDRTQAASQQQVQSMAQKLSPDELLMETNAIDRGAPVINADRVVLAGNGRTMATRLAPPERYDAYKAALTTQASQFGIDPAQLATMKKPVLVRRLQNADELAFSAEANQSAVLAMNELEKAKQLAKQVTDQDLRNLEMGASRTVAGALNQQRNMPFVQRFMSYVPANERAALMDAKGGITPALVESVRATLFAMVFKDNVVLANYVMSGAVDLKNIGNGIESVIQKLALLQKTNPALAIGDDIGEAATILMRLRSEGTSLDTFLAQIGMFDKPPREEVAIILRAFNENMRSGKAIGDFLNEYADAALRYATGQTSDLIEVPTKLDLLNNVSGGTSRFQEALFQPARNRRYRPPMRGPDWANADTIHRAWDADARFISNTRNQADPSIGRISQDDMRHMAEARDTIHRTLPEAWNNPTPNTLTREQRIVALDSLQKAMQGWDNTIAASQWLGNQAADFAMLNYSRRRNFDTILAMLMPYHYFWSRSATNWGQRVLRKPSIGNLYWEMEHHMQQAERQRDLQNSGLPARVDDRVRVPIWGDWFMGNPLNLLLPFNSYLMNSYVDPETANNAYEKAWLQARGVMPVGAPGYNFIIDAMLDAIFPREGDLSRKDEYGIGDIAPLVAQGTAWQQAIWGTHAPTWASGDPYRIGLSARQVGTDSTIPLEMRKWAKDVGYQLLHNVGALPEQPAEAERVWTDAAKAAGFDKAMALSLAFVLGLPFARVRVQEQEANQALNTYRTLGYSERNPAGSASAKRTFAEETNYLPFSKAAAAGLYLSRTESVGDPEGAFDRPGYSALRDQKKQEKEALDAEYEQRINDFWKANEWSDPKVQKQGIEEIDAWHREAKAALEQKYADMPEGEFPTAYQSYSPEEVQAAALENAARQASEYAQEAVTLPPYPGDDASDEVWDAYGAAKDKQTQAEIDSLTRLLMNKVALSKLVNGRSVTPYSETEARKLAEEMVADISWMPEGKQEWVAQKEQRQAEWEAQEAEAMRLFGNNILDIAEEYDSNWPAAKKEAFLDKYPKLIEYWEWRDANWTDDSEDTEFQREWEQNVATERERRNDAMEMFGDDIFDIRDGYDSDWPQWKKDEYKAKYPQLQKFWDWWYDDGEAGTDGGFKDKLVRGGVGKNKRTGARKGVGGQTTKSRSSRPRREPYVKGARPFRARRFRPGSGGAGSLAPAGGVGDFSNTDWGFPQGSYLGNNWDEGMQGPQLYRPGDMMRIPMSSLRSWK